MVVQESQLLSSQAFDVAALSPSHVDHVERPLASFLRRYNVTVALSVDGQESDEDTGIFYTSPKKCKIKHKIKSMVSLAISRCADLLQRNESLINHQHTYPTCKGHSANLS